MRASRAGSAPRLTGSVDLLGADSLLVSLDDLGDQLLDVRIAAGADVSVLDGFDVVADMSLGRELIEIRAGDRNADTGILSRSRLADLGSGQLDPEHLHVAPSAQLELEDELQLG